MEILSQLTVLNNSKSQSQHLKRLHHHLSVQHYHIVTVMYTVPRLTLYCTDHSLKKLVLAEIKWTYSGITKPICNGLEGCKLEDELQPIKVAPVLLG